MLPFVTLVSQSVTSYFFWRWNSFGNEKKTNIIFQKGKYPKLMLTPELLQLKAKFWVTQTFRWWSHGVITATCPPSVWQSLLRVWPSHLLFQQSYNHLFFFLKNLWWPCGFCPDWCIFLRISKMPQMGNPVRILLGYICARADTGRGQRLHTDDMATQAEILFNATIG